MPGYWPTCLSDGWEYCFHLSKSQRPYFNSDAVRKPIGDWVESRLTRLGKNDLTRQNSGNASGFGRDISKGVGKETVLPSNVISLALVGKNRGHPAVFPVDLPRFFIKLLCPPDGLVVDPFAGSGSTGLAAISQNRRCVLIDNNATYCQIAERRLIEEAVVPRSNGRHSVLQTNGLEQAKLLDASPTSSKPLPKSQPVSYSKSKRKKATSRPR
jgi:site-specific DNA-methyltransferase (adenine-specific)/site-specific DNA-methyltransferase (cytosine-N4-specific)